jgi:hypothetical protein
MSQPLIMPPTWGNAECGKLPIKLGLIAAMDRRVDTAGQQLVARAISLLCSAKPRNLAKWNLIKSILREKKKGKTCITTLHDAICMQTWGHGKKAGRTCTFPFFTQCTTASV